MKAEEISQGESEFEDHEACAVVVRFEECLCGGQPTARPRNVVQFPARSTIRSEAAMANDGVFKLEDQYPPLEFEREIGSLVKRLRWRSGAVWFLKSLMREGDIRLFVVSNYPTQVVERKLANIAPHADVVASLVTYDAARGQYMTQIRMDAVKRGAFLVGLREARPFKQVIYLGPQSEECVVRERITNIVIGQVPERASRFQFVVRNFMEAHSVLHVARSGRDR